MVLILLDITARKIALLTYFRCRLSILLKIIPVDNQSRDYTCNSEFAIDKDADKIVMIRPIQPMPNDYPNYLNSSLEIDYMNLSDFTNQR